MSIPENSKHYCKILRIESKNKYSDYERVYCKILKEYVYFNSIGFRHLIYKRDGTPRTFKEQIYKLTLLPLVIPVIKNADVILEIRNISFKYGSSSKRKTKQATTYALSAFVGKNRSVDTRVILLRVGNGKLVFYSVMRNSKQKTPRC